MVRLESYLQDTWVAGEAPMTTLYNPATEAPVAETSTRGLDFAGAFRHAREVGGPALRALSFAERGALLKAASKALYAEREALLAVAMQNGAGTRGDAKFDIDGATGTLAYYAGLGRKLGDRRHLVDGEIGGLTQSARFGGVHLLVPRRGVAVHINAFNFPAWGTFEKAAVALLAGVPVITKPATSTAWLTYEMVKIVAEADILPPGALQLVAGSAGDLLSHLGGQDMLAFTGSADTGARLRGGEGPVTRSTRINIEADSLNAAVLGPDVQRDSTLWHWFVRSVVLEMTQKAGQKCTAIRRVLAPAAAMQALQEDLVEELSRVVVGAPGAPGATMGPLATRAQLEDYRAGVAELAERAEIVFGSASPVRAVGVPEGVGYFAGPVLLRAADSRAAGAVHRREVFGPVATLLPYDGAEDAADIVALGGGSLVSTVVSDDRDFLRQLGLAIGAFNGRVMVIDTKVADQSTPHGMVLPQLVHGGPGRAGGGEELGAERGLGFYLQRVAVQGNRALLKRLFTE